MFPTIKALWSSHDDAKLRMLHKYRYVAVCVGLSQTMLCAGVVFGWSALESVFLKEGVFASEPSMYTAVFTYGAIGNYLSNLPCGWILDTYGPMKTGIVAAFGFALGVFLCSITTFDQDALAFGYLFLGFFGPCVQLPTLHLACLFPQNSAAVMSMQAAAFDSGSIVFYLAKIAYKYSWSTANFFRLYLVVPAYILVVSLAWWPGVTMNNDEPEDEDAKAKAPASSSSSESAPLLASVLPPPQQASTTTTFSAGEKLEDNSTRSWTNWLTPGKENLHGADLARIMTSTEFWTLTAFTAIHILKLNFVIATIDFQMDTILPHDADELIWNFGWMLPLGFVIMPVSSYLLEHKGVAAFQLANLFGVVYGWSINVPIREVQLFVTFPLVALSRQLVYGCVFFTISKVFGYKHFGVTLGVANIAVSFIGLIQYPVALAAENAGTWKVVNAILACIGIPLFAIPFFLTFVRDKKPRKPQTSSTPGVEASAPYQSSAI